MANVKTAISLEESLFHQIEAVAQEMQIPRSRLFVLAVRIFSAAGATKLCWIPSTPPTTISLTQKNKRLWML